MSKESDIEMIFVEMLEQYAASHELSREEVHTLFRQHEIMTKITDQYEYLHQVSDQEMLEYVQTQIVSDNSMRLYHGTTALFSQIDLSRSYNRRDFGVGFYTTTIQDQAMQWGERLAERRSESKYYVMEYQYTVSSTLKIKTFEEPDKEWLDMVKKNRSVGGLQHDYDIIIGPVADDKTMRTIQLYLSGDYTDEEALARLRYSKLNDQVSFHTKRALDTLSLVRRREYAVNL